MFDLDKPKCIEYMIECSEFFAGNRKLGIVIVNEQYAVFFQNLSSHAGMLKCHSPNTGQLIHGFINSLRSILTYPIVNRNLQIKFYITETISVLTNIAKIASLRRTSLNKLALVSDFSYAWNLLDEYIDLMHVNIKKNSKTVMLFKSCFIKLASILNQPLRRIIELQDEKMLMTVSQYYSKQLVQFVEKVLSIIPIDIFKNLEKIANVINPKIKAEEAQINKEDFIAYSQLETRSKMAAHQYKISMFTDGILGMDKCLMGVIEVDPKELLVKGISMKLMKYITKLLNEMLIFKKDLTIEVFDTTINATAAGLENIKAALKYSQELIGINALKLWREQITHMMDFYIEYETSPVNIEKEKILKKYKEMKKIEIPIYDSNDGFKTFLSRLISGFKFLTSPTKPIRYFSTCNSWFDFDGKFVFGSKTIQNIVNIIGVVGATGLDKIISYMISKKINKFAKTYCKFMDGQKKQQINYIRKLIRKESSIELNESVITNIDKTIINFDSSFKTFFGELELIGRLQLIRKIIQEKLLQLARVDSKGFYQAVSNMNRCSLPSFVEKNDIEDNDVNVNKLEFLKYTSTLMDSMGISDPFKKIYIYPKFEMYSISHIFAILTLDFLKSLSYNKSLRILERKIEKKKPVSDSSDPLVLLAGIVTIFNHMHINYTREYIATLCYYIKLIMFIDLTKKKKLKIGQITSNIYIWLNDFCKMSDQSRDMINRVSSTFSFDTYPAEY